MTTAINSLQTVITSALWDKCKVLTTFSVIELGDDFTPGLVESMLKHFRERILRKASQPIPPSSWMSHHSYMIVTLWLESIMEVPAEFQPQKAPLSTALD